MLYSYYYQLTPQNMINNIEFASREQYGERGWNVTYSTDGKREKRTLTVEQFEYFQQTLHFLLNSN